MRETLKKLCALSGVSSHEDEVRDYIRQRVAPFADEIRVDSIGNLIVFKKGRSNTGNRLMVCAHMDEVGLMIRNITDDGYLKFSCVGGIDRRVLLGKRVFVGDKKYPGIIGMKAVHLSTTEEMKKLPKLTDFYIDIGAENQEKAQDMVSLGDVATFSDDIAELGDGFLKAKAIDDRVGCGVMLKLLEEELPMDCFFVFTVQEEVGTRGAFGAAFSVVPEIALILEGTTAADSPAMKGARKVCIPGKGPVISLIDGSTVYDRGLFELLRDLATEHQISWQVKHYLAGGTDAGAIQRSRSGVRVAGISAAVRYLHAPSSVVSLSDTDHILTLARLFINAVADL
jgi:putative aminopeptidase FrvX